MSDLFWQVTSISALLLVWLFATRDVKTILGGPKQWAKFGYTDRAILPLLAFVLPYGLLFYLNNRFMPETAQTVTLWFLVFAFALTLVGVAYWIQKNHYFSMSRNTLGSYTGPKKGRK